MRVSALSNIAKPSEGACGARGEVPNTQRQARRGDSDAGWERPRGVVWGRWGTRRQAEAVGRPPPPSVPMPSFNPKTRSLPSPSTRVPFRRQAAATGAGNAPRVQCTRCPL